MLGLCFKGEGVTSPPLPWRSWKVSFPCVVGGGAASLLGPFGSSLSAAGATD